MLFFALATAAALTLPGEADRTITTADELTSALKQESSEGRTFSIKATVTLSCGSESKVIPVEDHTGAAIIRKTFSPISDFAADAGEILQFSGVITRNAPEHPLLARCLSATRIGRAPPPPIRDFHPQLLESQTFDYRPLHLHGVIRDLLADEIDPTFMFLVVRCQDAFIPIPISSSGHLASAADSLIGAEIDMTGVCDPRHIGSRSQIGKFIHPVNESDIVVAGGDKPDAFAAPDIEELVHMSPQAISKQDRHRAAGKVVAVLQGNALVLKTPSGRFLGVRLAKGDSPGYGSLIDVVGFPESDLYRINLSRAMWRPCSRRLDVAESPLSGLSAESLLSDREGRRRFNPMAYGATVRVTGIVRSLSSQGDDDGIFSLECGNFMIPVDASALTNALCEIDAGCTVELTGTCVLESENWRPNLIFPKISRLVVVPRRAGDIRIVSRPPWWNPSRLLAVIGALLLALAAILVWNASLRILAQRRGHELFKSEIAKVASELRVNERTRLAVELHDSITQNLTGVTLQLDAASSARREDPAAADAMLDIARRALQSCLDELRRCLWDLRSEALEEPDFNKAIRIALRQVASRADVSICFSAKRSRISDATAHAILRIIRELATNAVRHGRATKVSVAGKMLPDAMRFVVSDNGTGFDMATAPGPGDGHFGLAGIRERLKALDGSLNIMSSRGSGTRADVCIGITQKPRTT